MDPESHPAAAQNLSSDALDDCVLEAVVHCAVVEGDEASWLTLHAIFLRQLLARSDHFGEADNAADPLAVRAWARLRAYYTPTKLRLLPGRAGLLRAFRLCIQSAVIDAERAAQNAAFQASQPGACPGDPASTSPSCCRAEDSVVALLAALERGPQEVSE